MTALFPKCTPVRFDRDAHKQLTHVNQKRTEIKEAHALFPQMNAFLEAMLRLDTLQVE